MGLFDIFKKKPVVVPDSLPTIKPEKSLYTSFDKSFFDVMKSVEGFTEKEIKEIHKFISASDFLNMGAWHERIFQEYFSGRDWKWKEYEFWDKKFDELGKFPNGWIRGESPELTPYDVFNTMKVAELKEFLISNNIEVPPKTKKENLLNLVEAIPNLNHFPIWKEQEEKRKKRQGYGLYRKLMLHITFKSTALYEIEKIEKLNMKYDLLIIGKEDQEFIDLALSINKNAIPPFFPTDITRPKIIVDFDSM